jgi:hypothetical protein
MSRRAVRRAGLHGKLSRAVDMVAGAVGIVSPAARCTLLFAPTVVMRRRYRFSLGAISPCIAAIVTSPSEQGEVVTVDRAGKRDERSKS